ncbi:MAG: fumarate hydratase [Alphaproteobacteria bacterium]
MAEFAYRDMFPIAEDDAPYRKLTGDHVALADFEGTRILKVEAEALTQLTFEAFRDISHLLRPGHLQQIRNIIDDAEASDNDRFVAYELLKNANIAAGGVLPMCQDTGTAIVLGKKGEQVWTGFDDQEAISHGVWRTFTETNLRYSQLAPIGTFEEVNTGNNLPAQLDIHAVPGDAYKFLFIAKGGGSANKTFLFQQTPAVLTKDRLLAFFDETLRTLGTAACPPYHLSVVIGGTSAELNLKTVKLASCRYLDTLPTRGDASGHAIRDPELEAEILQLTQNFGIGAQFGGKYFCHDIRVIRLPRHGASLPIGIGVSCAADRQALGKITTEGVFLEQLEANPARFMPDIAPDQLSGDVVAIDLNRPMDEIRKTLSEYPIKTRISVSGPMIVPRDAAHARLRAGLEAGEDLPQYFKDHCIYYAGPAKTPKGYATGAFGPTTAGRMDSYVDQFQSHGASMVMLAKGNRSDQVTKACAKHGGFYLGSIGGPGARLAQDCIKSVDCVAYEDLGMEAIWKIEVENFPAFIVVDDKGNDFFSQLNRR